MKKINFMNPFTRSWVKEIYAAQSYKYTYQKYATAVVCYAIDLFIIPTIKAILLILVGVLFICILPLIALWSSIDYLSARFDDLFIKKN